MWRFFTLPTLLVCSSLSRVVATITWNQRTGYPGAGRHHPITFANETHGFLLTGTTATAPFTSDFYIYEEATDRWFDVTNHTAGSAWNGFGPRSFGYGVVLPVANSPKAYLGFGLVNNAPMGDLWEFDMVTHSWKRLADFPGLARLHPAMVPVLNKNNNDLGVWEIHVGLGEGNEGNYNDWWSYSIDNNQWEQLSDFPSTPRHHPFYFGIAESAFAGLGHSDGRTIERDWFRFDASTRTWHPEANFASYKLDKTTMDLAVARSLQPITTEARVAGTQFSIEFPLYGTTSTNSASSPAMRGALGFVLSGDGDDHSTMEQGEFHAFYPGNFANNVSGWWMQLTPHPGVSRWAPGSFVMRGSARVYFTSGLERFSNIFYADLWQADLTSLFELPWDTITNPSPTPTPDLERSTVSPENDELPPQNRAPNTNSSPPINSVGLDSESSSGTLFLYNSLIICIVILTFLL
jgi:hypothetical protein